MTIKEAIQKLPGRRMRTYAKQNIRNLAPEPEERFNTDVESVSDAVKKAFDWSKTPEGFQYWEGLWRDQVSIENKGK